MPIKVLQEDGTEIEAFTPEEAEEIAAQKVQEAKEQYENELSETRAKLDETETEYAKLKDKDFNFEKLRKKADKKGDEDITERLNEFASKIKEDVVAEVKKVSAGDFKEEFINNNIGSDQELKDKFDYYFKKLGDGLTDRKELERAARESLVLAGGSDKASNSGGGVFRTSAGFSPGGQGVPESKREMGKMFGLSEEDYKKFGDK